MYIILDDNAVLQRDDEGDELEEGDEGGQLDGPPGRRPFWRRRRFNYGGRGGGYRGGPPRGRGGYEMQGYFPRGGMYRGRGQPRFYRYGTFGFY